MRDRERDFGALLLSIVALLSGVLTLATGSATWFNVVGISGVQAQLFGWASIVFALVCLAAYLRGSKRH